MTENEKPAENEIPKVDMHGLYKNMISAAGLIIGLIAALNIAILAIIEMREAHGNLYLGIIAYTVLPAFLALGIALFIFGMAKERRRRRFLPLCLIERWPPVPPPSKFLETAGPFLRRAS